MGRGSLTLGLHLFCNEGILATGQMGGVRRDSIVAVGDKRPVAVADDVFERRFQRLHVGYILR